MNTIHLSEEILQQIAIEGIDKYPSEWEHVKDCSACHSHVQVYRELIMKIEQSPFPEFQFDLQEAVLQKIPNHSSTSPATGRKYNNSILIMMAVIIAAGSLIYLFREKILQVSKIPDEFSLFLIMGSGLLLLGMIVWEMFKDYDKKMNVLNHQ